MTRPRTRTFGGFRAPHRAWLGIVWGLALLPGPGAARGAPMAAEVPIPVFSRLYRTGCSTCHVAAPKLNVVGEVFRLNGYRVPVGDDLLRADEPVPLGEEPWKDLWPRAVWPGTLPSGAPLAIRIQNDLELERHEDRPPDWNFRFPHEIYLLGAAGLGGGIAAFLEAEWSPEAGVRLVQAKVFFQDVLPFLPRRALNLWAGLQNLYLFTFADRQIDRAGREVFLWQRLDFSAVDLPDPVSLGSHRSLNDFQLRDTQPALELNGLLRGRLYYGLGLSQGASPRASDDNRHKDAYYKVRLKLGGLRLDGSNSRRPQKRDETVADRSLTAEHFGYFGAEPVEGGAQDEHRSFGVNLRALRGPLDLGLGYVWGTNRRPWGRAVGAGATRSALFAKAEVLALPWLIGSLKAEQLDVDATGPQSNRVRADALDRTHVVPGLIVLVRQNVRGVLESEIARGRLDAAWVRLDVAF